MYVTAGARFDDHDDFGGHTSARISAAYVQAIGAGRSLKYRTSFGRGFRAPSLYEIAYNAGPFAAPPAADVPLEEETSAGFDVGVEYAVDGGLTLELTYFDQRIEDEIYFDLAGFAGYLQSPGRSTSKGVEIASALPLGERFELLANWTYNDAVGSTNELRLRRPKHMGNVGFAYRGAGERLRLVANYRLSRESLDVGGIALDDYGVVDLSGTYALRDALEIYGRVQNLADDAYQEVLGFNTAGRSAYAGVRLRF